MSFAEPLHMTRDFFDKFNIAYTVLRKSIPIGKVSFFPKDKLKTVLSNENSKSYIWAENYNRLFQQPEETAEVLDATDGFPAK